MQQRTTRELGVLIDRNISDISELKKNHAGHGERINNCEDRISLIERDHVHEKARKKDGFNVYHAITSGAVLILAFWEKIAQWLFPKQ